MVDEFDDYEVRFLSADQCEQAAATLRRQMGLGEDDPLPPIMEVFQRARQNIPGMGELEILPRADEFMGRADAFAKHAQCEIVAKQSICEAAIDDEPKARAILVHELAHLIFHPGPRKFRIATGNKSEGYIGPTNSAEWQADRIMRAILMPSGMAATCKSSYHLSRLARVPLDEAATRIRELKEGQPRVPTPAIELQLAQLRLQSTPRDGGTQRAKLEADALKLALWSKLPTIDGEPPRENRNCGGYRIRWSEFGKTTECGWYVEGDKIASYFALKHQ